MICTIICYKYLVKCIVTKLCGIQKILIMAKKGGMTITAPGILKEDGFKNAMVQVLNIDSKKIIYGRLVDANTVKVKF